MENKDTEDYVDFGFTLSKPEQWCEEHQKEEFWIADPYQLEINGVTEMIWACEDCERRIADEI